MHCIPPSLRAPRSSLQFPDGSDRHCAEDLLRRLPQGHRCRIAQCRVSSSDGPKPAVQWLLQTGWSNDLNGPWTYWQPRTYLKHLETKIYKHNTCHWNSSRFSLRTQALKLHQVPSLLGEFPTCKVVRCMIYHDLRSCRFTLFSQLFRNSSFQVKPKIVPIGGRDGWQKTFRTTKYSMVFQDFFIRSYSVIHAGLLAKSVFQVYKWIKSINHL